MKSKLFPHPQGPTWPDRCLPLLAHWQPRWPFPCSDAPGCFPFGTSAHPALCTQGASSHLLSCPALHVTGSFWALSSCLNVTSLERSSPATLTKAVTPPQYSAVSFTAFATADNLLMDLCTWEYCPSPQTTWKWHPVCHLHHYLPAPST